MVSTGGAQSGKVHETVNVEGQSKVAGTGMGPGTKSVKFHIESSVSSDLNDVSVSELCSPNVSAHQEPISELIRIEPDALNVPAHVEQLVQESLSPVTVCPKLFSEEVESPSVAAHSEQISSQKSDSYSHINVCPESQVSQSELIDLHERVKASGVPNIHGVRAPLCSQWNIPFLKRELEGYDDCCVAELCEFGWPINISDSSFSNRGPPRNWRSATDYAEQMNGYIEHELSAGTLLGPFKVNPFSSPAVVSPLSTTEKRDSNERRVIMDLSFPPGDSVNEKIPKDQYLGQDMVLRYPTVDSLVELIKKKGRGCALMKSDFRRAYKQIQVDPADWNFLGLTWNGSLYFDVTMPMGLRSAAMCCQRLTNAIKYIVERRGYDLVAYLDDMVTAEDWQKAEHCYFTIRWIIKESGAEEAHSKSVPPTCTMLFLGVLFDTESLTLSIDEDRLVEILSLLEDWMSKTHMTRKEVETVAGKLGFVASVVRPGRLFVSRVLEFLRGLPKVGRLPLPESFLKDLLWWKTFLPRYNGISMMPWEDWSGPDEVFSSDACLLACGAWCSERTEFFHIKFPEFISGQHLSINALELLTIVVATKVWGKFWQGRRIVVHCDNEVAVTVLNTGRSHNKFLLSCLREIELLAARHEFEIRGNHIPGVENRISDALSRWDIDPRFEQVFRNQVGHLQPKECFVYEGLFQFLADW